MKTIRFLVTASLLLSLCAIAAGRPPNFIFILSEDIAHGFGFFVQMLPMRTSTDIRHPSHPKAMRPAHAIEFTVIARPKRKNNPQQSKMKLPCLLFALISFLTASPVIHLEGKWRLVMDSEDAQNPNKFSGPTLIICLIDEIS